MRALWLAMGSLAIVLGAAGIFLPLLPTVPFLLLAGFAFARSSERLHLWLLTHPVLGPPIADWRDRGAIGRRAKVLASLSIGAAFAMSVALGLATWVLVVQALALCCVAVFIWSRPEI